MELSEIIMNLVWVAVAYTIIESMTDSKFIATIAGIVAIFIVFKDDIDIKVTTTQKPAIESRVEESNPIENFIDTECVEKYGKFACGVE